MLMQIVSLKICFQSIGLKLSLCENHTGIMAFLTRFLSFSSECLEEWAGIFQQASTRWWNKLKY